MLGHSSLKRVDAGPPHDPEDDSLNPSKRPRKSLAFPNVVAISSSASGSERGPTVDFGDLLDLDHDEDLEHIAQNTFVNRTDLNPDLVRDSLPDYSTTNGARRPDQSSARQQERLLPGDGPLLGYGGMVVGTSAAGVGQQDHLGGQGQQDGGEDDQDWKEESGGGGEAPYEQEHWTAEEWEEWQAQIEARDRNLFMQDDEQWSEDEVEGAAGEEGAGALASGRGILTGGVEGFSFFRTEREEPDEEEEDGGGDAGGGSEVGVPKKSGENMFAPKDKDDGAGGGISARAAIFSPLLDGGPTSGNIFEKNASPPASGGIFGATTGGSIFGTNNSGGAAASFFGAPPGAPGAAATSLFDHKPTVPPSPKDQQQPSIFAVVGHSEKVVVANNNTSENVPDGAAEPPAPQTATGVVVPTEDQPPPAKKRKAKDEDVDLRKASKEAIEQRAKELNPALFQEREVAAAATPGAPGAGMLSSGRDSPMDVDDARMSIDGSRSSGHDDGGPAGTRLAGGALGAALNRGASSKTSSKQDDARNPFVQATQAVPEESRTDIHVWPNGMGGYRGRVVGEDWIFLSMARMLALCKIYAPLQYCIAAWFCRVRLQGYSGSSVIWLVMLQSCFL